MTVFDRFLTNLANSYIVNANAIAVLYAEIDKHLLIIGRQPFSIGVRRRNDMETFETINMISKNPNIRGGRPCIAGTSLEVAVIAIDKIVHRRNPEEIATDYVISLPQAYAALAYYYDNKDEIDKTIKDRQQLAQEFKEKQVGSRRQSLFG
jgi:uncharacterized protein (DUF433 family)